MTSENSPVNLSENDSSAEASKAGFPFSEDLLRQIEEVISNGTQPEIEQIFSLSGYSNNTVRLDLEDGRSLMVKKAQYEWAGPRFQSSRRASKLLQKHTSVVTPQHVPITGRVENKPVLAYWYIPHNTLEEEWTELTYVQKAQAIRSLGRLLRDVHKVEVESFGSLSEEEASFHSISEFMESDLLERLKPAVWAKWYDAIPVLDQLAQLAPQLPGNEQGAVLVHNDLHLGNILCEWDEEKLQCLGVLDLEAAGGGNWISDVASAIVMYDPLFFGQESEWIKDFETFLMEGYGKEADPVLLHFFKTYHLLNLGFFSILNDDRLHAQQTLEMAQETLNRI